MHMQPGSGPLPPINAKPERGRKRRLVRAVVMVIAFAALIWLGFLASQEYKYPRNLADIPLIESDKSAFKIKPEDPGGMEIPNQGRQVYNAIAGNDTVPAAKTPSPSVNNAASPTDKPALKKDVPVQLPIHSESENIMEQVNQVLQPEKNSVVVQTDETDTTDTAETEDGHTVPEPVQAPNAKEKVMGSLEGHFVVQLGSFRSEEGAKQGWQQLYTKFPTYLGGMITQIKPVKLGSKGVFYRLFAGPLDSRDAALELCKSLTEKQQGCLVSSL